MNIFKEKRGIIILMEEEKSAQRHSSAFYNPKICFGWQLEIEDFLNIVRLYILS